MKVVVKIIIVLGAVLMFQSCYKEKVIFEPELDARLEMPSILSFDNQGCSYDSKSNTLRYPIDESLISGFSPFVKFHETSILYFEGNILENNSINNLGDIEINTDYSITVETGEESHSYVLSFTNLPIVQINIFDTVYNEPKRPARIFVNHTDNSKDVDYFIGIEYRGLTSLTFPKKSYGISIKGNMDMGNSVSRSLFGMRENNDWILDAMYMDKTRLRNKISFELWRMIDGEDAYGIRSEFVELYINNEHQGLYCFNEKINAEFLELYSSSVLYKAYDWHNGSVRFETYSDSVSITDLWDGWEQKFPDPRSGINWEPLRELRNMVVNENDSIFESEIGGLVEIESCIDYYILMNTLLALDNTGKNVFFVKASPNEPFRMVPWDLDATIGLQWDGAHLGYYTILSNNLFVRLFATNPEDFRGRLKEKWQYLRNTSYNDADLFALINQNFDLIKESNVIEIENRIWNLNIDTNTEQEFLIDWLEHRLIVLDNYYQNL